MGIHMLGILLAAAMGVLILGVLLSAAMTAVALWLANLILGRFWKLSLGRPLSICLGILLSCILTLPATMLSIEFSTATRLNAPPRDGESRLAFVHIPPNTTSDFNYRYSLIGVTLLADFKMSEADYLAWMESQDLKPTRFEIKTDDQGFNGADYWGPVVRVLPVRTYSSGTSLQLHRGYRATTSMPNNPDNTTTYIYDLEDGRVYFMHTTY